jgi:steroid delta-isomerase-like uncharacterized protein
VSSSENKQVVMRYVDAFNRSDTEALRGLFTDDALVYGVLGWGALDVAVPIWEQLHAAFAIALEVEAIVEEGDTVAVRYTERGTSIGAFRGLEPTGKSYEIVAIEWFTIRDGRIHRRWGARDSAALFRQMGLPLG